MVAALCLLLLGWFGVGTASAHDVLIGSNPADGASVAKAPDTVTFTFDQPVTNFAPEISVTGPGGTHLQTGPVTVTGNVVSSAVRAGPDGGYVAAYRIVSADGHPVTGQISFTVGAGVSAPAGSAVPVTTAPARGGSDWLWIVLGVAGLLIVAAVVVLLRRPRGDPGSTAPDD